MKYAFIFIAFFSFLSIFYFWKWQEVINKKNVNIPTQTELIEPTTSVPLLVTEAIATIPPKTIQNRTIPESELISAINIYRQANGLAFLATNSSLCVETRKRVNDMILLNSGKETFTLNHDGMDQDVKNGTLHNLVNKSSYGENIASAYCRNATTGEPIDISTGTQLVEWCFANSPGHKATLLNPSWTDVCSSGSFPYYVQTFAK